MHNFPLRQLLGLKENRGKKICFEHFTGLPRAASSTQTCPHICTHTHTCMPPCCGASKPTVKFSHGGTQYRLSYPLYWTPSETSSVHRPSITRLLFTAFLREHGHGSPLKGGKPIPLSCNHRCKCHHLINRIRLDSVIWHSIMLTQSRPKQERSSGS